MEAQRRVLTLASFEMAPAPERGFLIAAVLAFVASAAVTIAWCASMAGMDGMAMPGGWIMSMAWMLMPGQNWADAAAAFVGMWAAMMVTMMLPSLVPMLRRYRRGVGSVSGRRLDALTAIVAAAYFLEWILLGVAVFPVGVLLAEVAMRSDALAHAVPLVTGLVVLGAGALQFTTWKQRQLDCCRQLPRHPALPADAGTAGRHGLRLGLHCIACSAGLTATLLVIGVMDPLAMAVVMTAITAERLLPAGERVARGTGAVLVLGGMFQLVQALT